MKHVLKICTGVSTVLLAALSLFLIFKILRFLVSDTPSSNIVKSTFIVSGLFLLTYGLGHQVLEIIDYYKGEK